MRDILPTLVRWRSEGRRVAIATVVERRGSAPRDPGASLALNDRGEIAGSVTGGCVEPSVIREAQEVLDGGDARVREYGIADDQAFEVGLACGGTVGILIARLDTVAAPRARRGRRSRPAGRADDDRDRPGARRAAAARRRRRPGRPAARERRERARRRRRRGRVRPRARPAPGDVSSSARSTTRRRSRASASCSATASPSATRARPSSRRSASPRRTSSSSTGPTASSARTPVDERTVICVLTHDEKFDVPALIAALETPAVYIGAMGSKVTTADREERLRAEGVGDAASPASTLRSAWRSAPARPRRSRSRSARRSSRRPLSPAAARRTSS